ACLSGEETSDEPTQYAHFCEWQAALIEDEEAEEGNRYWQQQTVSALPAPALPFEAPSSGEPPSEFLTHCVELDAEALQRIDATAKRYDTTANVMMLECWQTLLWRLTGQPEITVGKIFDGRKFEELQDALGLLAKCLPVRLHFSGELQFGEVLRQLHKSV